jgi:hypothetical protein
LFPSKGQAGRPAVFGLHPGRPGLECGFLVAASLLANSGDAKASPASWLLRVCGVIGLLLQALPGTALAQAQQPAA